MVDPTRTFTEVNRRTVLQSLGAGAVGSVQMGTAAGRRDPGQFEARKGSSLMVDIKVTHDIQNDVPVRHTDRFIFPTYLNNGRLYYVGADVTNYVPNSPIVRTPFGQKQPTSFRHEVDLGGVIEADDAGAYAKLIGIDKYSVDATVEPREQSVIVTVENREVSIQEENRREVTLEPREIEVPSYEQKTVTAARDGISGTKEIRVPSGTKIATVTPTVIIQNHGKVDVIGERDARVFPETMPGGNALWHAVESEDREINNGIVTIEDER